MISCILPVGLQLLHCNGSVLNCLSCFFLHLSVLFLGVRLGKQQNLHPGGTGDFRRPRFFSPSDRGGARIFYVESESTLVNIFVYYTHHLTLHLT